MNSNKPIESELDYNGMSSHKELKPKNDDKKNMNRKRN